MRPILYIIALLFTQLIFSQDINRPSSLPVKTIKAYELKAESKAEEFFNYLELLSDPKINTEMKAQASAEAIKLFESGAVAVSNIFDKTNKDIALEDFVQLVSKQKNIKFKLEEFSADQNKHTTAKQEWELSYSLTINGKKTYAIRQKFFIVQEDKKFGSTIKKVWNTYLGEFMVIK